MSKKILVLGATGTVGRPVVSGLVAKGEAVKAASRSGQQIEGAEATSFDFSKPETISAALEGVDRAYMLMPAGYLNVQELLLPFVQAAASRKVKVVFQSTIGVDAGDAIPYRQVEVALENSGTPYVILRPNWFSDNFHTFWKKGLDHGQIALPAGDGKLSFIDVRDIAASAIAALTSTAFDGKVFNLNGPEALSFADAAAILSEVTGKPVRYTATSDETFIDMLKGGGVSADYASFMASIFYPVRQGRIGAVTNDVATLTGKIPRTLRAYAQDNLAASPPFLRP
ncbi:SDR family oxidoreductase [Dickeya dianthicola]|uniref:SDR family oxidoreductase n=1 Tax=Dickeya dianthicola TaxID=204039 RepID=UPI0003D79364|nr:SDR family oxidoreductase [Dickeya dianthicola]MCI4030082.1 SDR family oxidoreductase [Dickeya dianthicola]MCI4171764.1 SDR family oxidoreductase [Dickeya dianthicola]MCI4176652.1 SDR family oxidoreductase [Dickeya dianthicola]MCI4182516.1 SDR family oxidoreductase [Dickeya dianthicola]MCI4195159.1 SDR family oxidoreductase [Dickeya dianthicola]